MCSRRNGPVLRLASIRRARTLQPQRVPIATPNMLTDTVGWMAALLLLATMARQVWTQWTSGAVGGVSSWLFIGQIAASLAFTLYSALVGNAVFVATNLLMTVNGIAGLCIDRRNRRRQNP
jgi:MtN3 and saliva related transmembrane protein